MRFHSATFQAKFTDDDFSRFIQKEVIHECYPFYPKRRTVTKANRTMTCQNQNGRFRIRFIVQFPWPKKPTPHAIDPIPARLGLFPDVQ